MTLKLDPDTKDRLRAIIPPASAQDAARLAADIDRDRDELAALTAAASPQGLPRDRPTGPSPLSDPLLRPGDLILLRSGSRKLCVEVVEGEQVYLVWYADEKIRRACVPAACIRRIEPHRDRDDDDGPTSSADLLERVRSLG